MATEADRVVIDIIARMEGARESAQTFDTSMRQIEHSADRAEKKVVQAGTKIDKSLQQAAQRSRLLGFQIQDIGTQLAAGSSPFIVLAQQGPQVAQALDGARGAAGRMATFFSGPWGAALLAASTILGGFLLRNRETSESVDDLVEKLKDNAEKTRRSAEAQDIFAGTLEGVTKAVNDLEDALDDLDDGHKTLARRSLELAIATRDRIALLQAETRALIEQAKARIEVANISAGLPGADPTVSAQQLSGRLEALADLEQQMLDAEKTGKRLDGLITRFLGRRVVERAQRDAAEAANDRFDAQARAAEKAASREDILTGKLKKQVDAIEAARKAELKRIEDVERARKKTGLPDVTGAEVARALGTTINPGGGTRTPAQNKAAGGAANSFHLTGQAIDIPLTVNGKPLTKAGIRAVLEPLGVEIKELLGPGDKDHDDHFHIAFGKKRLEPDDIARKRQQAAERLEREQDREVRRLQAFNNEIADLDQAILDARTSMGTSIEARAQAELQNLDLEQKQFEANLKSLVAREELTAIEAALLTQKKRELTTIQKDIVTREAERQRRELNLQVAQGLLDNDLDLLRSENDLATSQKERRRIALAILDIEYEKMRLALENQLIEAEKNKASAAELAVIRQRLANLDQLKANATEGARRDTAFGFEAFFDGIRQTGQALDEELENIAVGGLQSIIDGLGQAAAGFTSLGDVARGVLAEITAALVRLVAQQLILKLLGETIGATTSKVAGDAKSGAQAAASGANAASAATVAQAATVAAAWAPAAAAASLATLGANQGPAIAALLITHAVSAALAAAGAAVGGAFAGGGRIHGPGGPTSDKVHIRASNDEFMFRAAAARNIGYDVLDYMNRTGSIPAFASGGRIGPDRMVRPMNIQAAAGRGGNSELSERSVRQLRQIVAESRDAMPNVALYPTIDAADVHSRGLNSQIGTRNMIAWLGANSGKVKAALNRPA